MTQLLSKKLFIAVAGIAVFLTSCARDNATSSTDSPPADTGNDTESSSETVSEDTGVDTEIHPS